MQDKIKHFFFLFVLVTFSVQSFAQTEKFKGAGVVRKLPQGQDEIKSPRTLNQRLQLPQDSAMKPVPAKAVMPPAALRKAVSVPQGQGDNLREHFSDTTDVIELLYAGTLSGTESKDGQLLRKVHSDSTSQVIFRHDGDLYYCDSAVQYVREQRFRAMGNVKIIQGDSLTIYADSLLYSAGSKVAQFRGRVLVNDQNRTLRTNYLDYHTTERYAKYYGGATIQDDSSTLWADYGFYDAVTQMSGFGGDVRMVGTDNEVRSDSLTYSAADKKVYFNATTEILTPDGGKITTEGGYYDTVIGKTKIESKNGSRSRIDNDQYIITAEFLDYDNITEKGVAKKNVEVFSKKERMTLFGDEGYYNGVKDQFDLFGNALMVRPFASGDTLYLSADTLQAVDDTLTNKNYFTAYPSVKIYRQDLQAICDSMAYNAIDSAFFFYDDPVLWAGTSQMTAREIVLTMDSGMVDELILKRKAYIVQEDTLENYNQIKGKIITVHFVDNEIHKVDVDGNAQSIYYMLDDTQQYVRGMNRISSSNMFLYFLSGELADILFVKKPEGRLIPPHELRKEDTYFDGFSWRAEERPDQSIILGGKQVRNPEAEVARETGTILTPTGANHPFKVILRDENVIFYRETTTEEELKALFFVHFTPNDPADLPEGTNTPFVMVNRTFTAEDLEAGQRARFPVPLPNFPVKKIVAGQRVIGGGVRWQVIYNVPEEQMKKHGGQNKTIKRSFTVPAAGSEGASENDD